MSDSRRLAFLRTFVNDCVSGTRKSYNEYGQDQNQHPDKIRRWIRDFKAEEDFTKWYGKVKVEEAWLLRVGQARTNTVIQDKLGLKDIKTPYEGLRPRRVWEAQAKGGEIKVLHSYENPQALEEVQIFKDRIVSEILDRFRETLYSVQPVDIIKPVVPSSLLMNIYTADKHVGACNKRGLYETLYNKEVFTKRMAATLSKIAQMSALFGGFDTIQFIELGDGLDGPGATTVRGGHGLQQNLDGHEQFDTYLSVHKGAFDALAMAGFAKNIRLTAAANDNHGGFAMYAAARALEEYINARYPEIVTLVSRDFMFHVEYGVHRHILTHGKDDLFMNRGWPMTLTKDVTDKINRYIDFHGLSRHLDFGMEPFCLNLIKGDLHTSNEEYSDRFRYKNIMSMYGSSPFVEHNYGPGYSGFEYEIIAKDAPDVLSGKYINR